MSDEQKEVDAPEAKGSGALVKLIGVGVVALGIGAGTTWFLVRPSAPEAPAADATGEVEEAAEPAESGPFEDRVVALDPIVVNLGSSGPPRYLKANLSLELTNTSDVAIVSAQLPRIRDAIIVLLSSRRLADIQEFSGKVLIKEDILDRVNSALEVPSVKSVLFTEFVVQ